MSRHFQASLSITCDACGMEAHATSRDWIACNQELQAQGWGSYYARPGSGDGKDECKFCRATREGFEERTLAELLRQGLASGEVLATPKIFAGGKVIHTKKVLADIVGVWPGGRGLLCECKVRSDKGKFRRPRPSDFELHQRERLLLWDRAGASALVAYTTNGLDVLIEPAVNFFPTTDPCPPAGPASFATQRDPSAPSAEDGR